MTWSRIKTFIAHYVYGLASASWQAGIRAVKLSGGIALGAAIAPASLPMPDIKLLLSVFVAAVFWEGIDYFNDHPLPVLLPPEFPPAKKPPVYS